ncbi:MAG: SRPBCC domain-containing protein [Deltaproteobacteria bacterium]|nr:SRPBCC domain-containing protein [Deltaproteobacteria bacterium]
MREGKNTAATPAIPVEPLTTAERASDRELVVRRAFAAPASVVFAAWSQADLFRQWWVPKSCGLTLVACEMDVRVGGQYRLVFGFQDTTMEVFGRYCEVTPPARLVWTNEEGDDGETITTVTFDQAGDSTVVAVRDVYASKEALEAAIASGATSGLPESLDQLDEFLGQHRSGPA